MVVADVVLVDVVHSEAAGLTEVLAIARALDGAVAWSLDDSEDDGLRLQQKGTRAEDEHLLLHSKRKQR